MLSQSFKIIYEQNESSNGEKKSFFKSQDELNFLNLELNLNKSQSFSAFEPGMKRMGRLSNILDIHAIKID
jgi:hypothetical protein